MDWTIVLIGALAVGACVVMLALLIPRRTCGVCATPLPRWRRPHGVREAMSGGWQCPGRGSALARRGVPLDQRD